MFLADVREAIRDGGLPEADRCFGRRRRVFCSSAMKSTDETRDETRPDETINQQQQLDNKVANGYGDDGSDSDDAPEEVSLATGRSAVAEMMRSERQAQIRYAFSRTLTFHVLTAHEMNFDRNESKLKRE